MNSPDSKSNKLTSLFEENYDRVARYVYARIGDKTEAEDIASEVFVHALESIKTYDDRGLPMLAWIFRIAHNLVVDHFRKTSRGKMLSIDIADMTDESDPISTAEINLEMSRVNEAMQGLTEEQREVVRLRFFGGLTSKEAGAVLNKSDGAVREMQRAALERLRTWLNTPGAVR